MLSVYYPIVTMQSLLGTTKTWKHLLDPLLLLITVRMRQSVFLRRAGAPIIPGQTHVLPEPKTRR